MYEKKQILKCPERITKYYLWDTTSQETVWCILTKLPQPTDKWDSDKLLSRIFLRLTHLGEEEEISWNEYKK